MTPSAFREKVYAFTQQKALFSAPCRVVVGLSGGPDSMSLLHTLAHWPQPGLHIEAVHIHHGLRQNTADRDADFVAEQCALMNIPLHVFRVSVKELAQHAGIGLEEAGRQVRYTLFEQVRQETDCAYILTGHNADDQTETVLMHLIRGCGVDGLAGIPAARDCVRRPLLCCTRQEIEAYCADEYIPFVTDETNSSTAFTRNKIRHCVLPLLRELNPEADAAVRRMADAALEDSRYLQEKALEALYASKMEDGSYSLELFRTSPVIRRRMLRHLLRERKVPSITQAHLEQLDAVVMTGQGRVSLPGHLEAAAEQGRLRFYAADFPAESSELPLKVADLPFSFSYGGQRHTLEVMDASSNVHKLFFKYAADYDRIQGGLTVRCRAEGETMRPAGRGLTKSVKKLMNEWKIPTMQRDSVPMLCDESGILLIPGFTCDERVCLTEDTKRCLVWRIDKLD